ncbi:MAG: hypothetical protein QN178_01770 [Armatimonadota bacterium]|nr:hypothetical protein [Armatimonadota bacterium]
MKTRCRVLAVVGISALILIGRHAASPALAGPGEGPENAPGASGIVLGDGVIVPGQRVGSVRLKMSIHEIIATVGRPPKREEFPRDGIILYEWRTEGLWVSQTITSRAIRVVSVFGTSDRYRTNKGVSLMGTRANMEAAHGKGYRQYDYPADRITLIRYPNLGLQFGLVNQPSNPTIHNRIFQIGIFAPGDLPPLRKPSS